MRIVGLLETGMMYLDESKAYSSLATVQKLMGVDKSYISDINLRLSDRELAFPLAQRLTRQFGYKALDWKTANAAFETGSGIRSIMALAVSITLLVVAGFGIYNILNMTIYEKMRDIAILKAMGFDGNDITGIFLSQAIIIGLLGGVAGLLLGLGLCSLISIVPFKGGAMFSMDTLPINFHADTYILGIVFALLTTALAGWLPARKAARLDPVDIINA
jgi:lipoprotein-releasing system permease protein